MSHRVLIVDDEAGIRQALKQVLEYEDLEVRVAASGGEAITLYAEFRPDLVFLDVKMAGLDGLETLTRLRDLDPQGAGGHDLRPRHHRDRGRGHPARCVRFPGKAARHRPAPVTVRNALAHAELVGENIRLREAAESRYTMVGESPALIRCGS